MAGLTATQIHAATNSAMMTGRKTSSGRLEAVAAPISEPINASTVIGSAARMSGRTLRR